MITLQFAAGGDFSSAAIEWFTQGCWSHVDAVLPDGRLLGARFDGGVAIREPGYARFRKTARITLPATAAQDAAFHDFLAAQLGKPYDWRAILAFALGRDWQEQDSWICSELQAAAMVHAGCFAHPLCVPSNKISPDSLAFLLSAFAPVIGGSGQSAPPAMVAAPP